MIKYLVDSSALWRIIRDDSLRQAWSETIEASAIGSCQPQRVEFRRSARDATEFSDISVMFDKLYPDVPVPKIAWQWADAAQYRLLNVGAHRALSTIDLVVCATAALKGLVILHDDNDFVTAARHLTDVVERRVHDAPSQ